MSLTETRFARPGRAWGQCRRCGRRSLLRRLVEDPNTGQRVHTYCADPINPQEEPIEVADAVALENPAPDLDDAPTLDDEDARWGSEESDFR